MYPFYNQKLEGKGSRFEGSTAHIVREPEPSLAFFKYLYADDRILRKRNR